jgi:hypothetical protein
LFRVSVATVTLVFRGFGVEMTGVPWVGAVGCSMIAGCSPRYGLVGE